MSKDLIELAIEQLDFSNGQLFDCREGQGSLDQSCLIDKGDWLKAARKAGAEKIFFVDNNPVVVFARSSPTDKEKNVIFNKIWCLSRPRILFLEMDGVLSVLDLAQRPIHFDVTNERPELDILATLTATQSVAEQLQYFHRDNIESGKVFEGDRFGSIKHRADQALIADLKIVRKELMASGLSAPVAHALIGRSIFIRYLEDRGILTEAYFSRVADSSSAWQAVLQSNLPQECLDFSGIQALYPRVLQNKSFTYTLFRKLSEDFNGDMFPKIDVEESHIQDRHLRLLQELLYGDIGAQKKLFFYSYKFDIIPLDLISAIYEEFYHSSFEKEDKKGKARQDGAYYTPPALAEFVLARLLTIDVLKQTPRVLDPACGSGIFLVEAFRRMVRYRISQKGSSSISFDELKQILGKQIAGIEVNEEAARITAFSLYLAMLNYLDPPSIIEHIKKGNRLPNLVATEHKTPNHFANIHVGNAFAINCNDVGDVDVVVGNPPWGSQGNKAAQETRDRQNIMLQWCKDRSLPIGDKEPSQAFLWRATDFLKANGRCALLASAGVLFKHSSTTQAFRAAWMSQVCITEVFNFTHVREFFFQGAISPFVLIHFRKSAQNETPVEYWSPKQILGIKETQAVLLSKYDRAYLVRQDLTDKITWKVNWFGRHADADFINYLAKNYPCLGEFTSYHCVGFKVANKAKDADWLSEFHVLDNQSFSRYGVLSYGSPPLKVEHAGRSRDCYEGRRLLVKEGIVQQKGTFGRIIARVEDDSFSFNHSLHVLKLKDEYTKSYDLILGILWSSFARYYFFLTSSNWGVWNDKVLIHERLSLPLPSKLLCEHAEKVISIVYKLQSYHPQPRDLIHTDGLPKDEIDEQRSKWEAELDEAVFDLYDFTDEQRDLIRDCCEVTLPFFYQPYRSIGVTPSVTDDDVSWMERYAERFAQRWQPYLNKDEVLRADLHIGASGNMVAMEFYPADSGDLWNLKPKNNSWSYILEEIGKALPRPMGTSQILLDGIVHILTNHSIIVIKRNEKRFWTRSLAREDAESTLAKRMLETMPKSGGIE